MYSDYKKCPVFSINVMAYGFTTEYTASETKLSVSLGTRNLFLATKKTRNFTCVVCAKSVW